MCNVPEGSSLDGLHPISPTEGEQSGGGWLSSARGLLEANFFAAVADVGESDVSATKINVCVCACVLMCACGVNLISLPIPSVFLSSLVFATSPDFMLVVSGP